MIRGSLGRRLFMLVAAVTIPLFGVHEAIEIRTTIRTAAEQTAADALGVGDATVPLLKSALIVDDLATAQETLDNIMSHGQFRALRLLDPSLGRVLLEGRAVPMSDAKVPGWFANLLDLKFSAQLFAIQVGGTTYGTLVAEPSSRFLVANIWERIWTAVLAWLVTMVVTLILLRYTLRRDLRPLDDLADAARCLGEGDLSGRAPVSGVPELAETAIAFNRMADKLAGERERLEQQVRQATRELEQLITRIPVGVYKLRIAADDRMYFDYVSPRWIELLELDFETVRDNPWALLERLHPDEVDGFVDAFALAKAGPSPFQWEGRLRPGMRAGWIRIEATPTRQDDGAVLWEGIQYDVTERRQAGNLLQSIIDVVDEGLLLVDAEGRVMRANRRFQQLWNIPEALLRDGEDERLLAFVLEQLVDPAGFRAEVERLYPTDETTWAMLEFKDGRVFERYTCPAHTDKGRARLWAFRDISERRSIERDLLLLNQAVTHASEAFLICDPHYRVQYVNPSFELLFGYRLAEMRGQSIDMLLPDEPALASAHPIARDEFVGERLRRAKDGRLIPVLLKVSPMVDDAGNQLGFVGTMTDLSAIKAAEAARHDTLRELDSLIARIPVGVYKLLSRPDGEMCFTFVSRRWCELLEINEEEVYRNPTAAFTRIHPAEIAEFRRLHDESLATLSPFQWEGRLRDGLQVRWLRIESTPTLRDGGEVLWDGVQYDVSVTKEREVALDHIAHYDPLTGVPNRMLLADRLSQAIAQAHRNHTALAVCYLDLDGFKPVNDSLGHEAGDRLLVEIARRLRLAVRGGDTVARIGGDEFVLLLADLRQVEEYEATLNRLLEVVAEPFDIKGRRVAVSASIGIALYPKDDVDPDLLLRHADQAMYQAKQAGRGNYIFFDPNLEDTARRHRELLRRVEVGLESGEFELYYQPLVDMRQGIVVGFEALPRWRHPDKGWLDALEFLPLIEDNDLIVRLGEWVIENALTQLGRWLEHGMDVTVSVNVAARQLRKPDFSARLERCLERHPEVSARRLEIEINETAALSDMGGLVDLFAECGRLGVGFALDDFGTGYSSLTYLKKLPARTLKIDQNFVRDMLTDANALAIVEGVVELAEIFSRRVVAEGVDTVEHGLLLLGMNCDLVQGHAIANPMSADRVASWLADWRPDPAWCSAEGTNWSRNDRPLVVARHDHRVWVDRVVAYLANQVESPPELDSGLCRFGQWYADGGRSRYGRHPEFGAIADVHERVHKIGLELVEMADHGRRPEALARLPELLALRDDLLGRLWQLMAAVASET